MTMMIMISMIFVALVVLSVFTIINYVRVSDMKTTLAKKNAVLNELVVERSFGDRANRRLEEQITTFSQQLSILNQRVELLIHDNNNLRVTVEASERRVSVMESVIKGYDETRRREHERTDGLRIVK